MPLLGLMEFQVASSADVIAWLKGLLTCITGDIIGLLPGVLSKFWCDVIGPLSEVLTELPAEVNFDIRRGFFRNDLNFWVDLESFSGLIEGWDRRTWTLWKMLSCN